MAFIMNEYEVDEAVRRFAGPDSFDVPNLRCAVSTLDNLVQWTNRNSDGWPYWSKPSKASKHLQQLIYGALLARDGEDITREALRAALVPIKSFRTRQSADFDIVQP